eukprot:UN10370
MAISVLIKVKICYEKSLSHGREGGSIFSKSTPPGENIPRRPRGVGIIYPTAHTHGFRGCYIFFIKMILYKLF